MLALCGMSLAARLDGLGVTADGDLRNAYYAGALYTLSIIDNGPRPSRSKPDPNCACACGVTDPRWPPQHAWARPDRCARCELQANLTTAFQDLIVTVYAKPVALRRLYGLRRLFWAGAYAGLEEHQANGRHAVMQECSNHALAVMRAGGAEIQLVQAADGYEFYLVDGDRVLRCTRCWRVTHDTAAIQRRSCPFCARDRLYA